MPDSLTIQLQNQSNSDQVHAYITGLAIQHGGKRVLLRANGRDLYFPESPPGGAILQPLAADCAIPLGPPGASVSVAIPQMAGGRIWFSRGGQKLTFLLNPGPALVEPSVLNPSDANAGVDFAFAEFTLNADQLFANISYVDFVPRLPVALTLRTKGGAVQHVSGMPPDGLDKVCKGLREQAARDGRPWDKLVVRPPGQAGAPPLRALNPTHGDAVGASFAGYFEPLVERAWAKYHPRKGGCELKLDTQAAPGVVTGRVDPDTGDLVVGGERFAKPTTADILGCNSGPFSTGGASPARLAIIPRLAAALQRGTLQRGVPEPCADASLFYRCDGDDGKEEAMPTNHYARLVHAANVDGKGYAFAYDDVQAAGGADQSGKVNAGDPNAFIVAVGGKGAYAGDRMP